MSWVASIGFYFNTLYLTLKVDAHLKTSLGKTRDRHFVAFCCANQGAATFRHGQAGDC